MLRVLRSWPNALDRFRSLSARCCEWAVTRAIANQRMRVFVPCPFAAQAADRVVGWRHEATPRVSAMTSGDYHGEPVHAGSAR